MAAGTPLPFGYCSICDRDAGDIPAEVRVFVDGICLRCWVESVPDIHTVEDIPEVFRPLVPLALRRTVPA